MQQGKTNVGQHPQDQAMDQQCRQAILEKDGSSNISTQNNQGSVHHRKIMKSTIYNQVTPSILEKNVVLDKVWVKHWKYKSRITFKFLSFKIQKSYE